MLAALLYCGAGLGMALIRAIRPLRRGPEGAHSPDRLSRADLPLLALGSEGRTEAAGHQGGFGREGVFEEATARAAGS